MIVLEGSESLYYYDIYYSTSDSEDVQISSSATASRRSSYLTTSEDEDDVLNDGTTGHIVDRLVLLCTVNIVPLLSILQIVLGDTENNAV